MLINHHFAPPCQAVFWPIRDECFGQSGMSSVCTNRGCMRLHVEVFVCMLDQIENGILDFNRLIFVLLLFVFFLLLCFAI